MDKQNRGERNGNAKLNRVDVRAIGRRCDAGERVTVVARAYPGVSYNTVWAAARRRRWLHLA
jgi:hypothetical protein